MRRLSGGQVESLFDPGLPIEVRELPADLAALDRLLESTALLEPIVRSWDQAALVRGRPTIPMDRFVRLMLVKQRSGWGYETLVREVSDSLHLRRLCLIPLCVRVPDESTIRKLARRLGPDVIEEICRALIARDHRSGALCRAGGPDRLDRRRGRRALPDRPWPVRRCGRVARRSGGPRPSPGRRRFAAGGQPHPGREQAPARAQPHAGAAHRPGRGGGAAADRAGRRDRRLLDPREPAPGGEPAGPRPRAGRRQEARGSGTPGADRRAGRAGVRPDPPAGCRAADPRSPGVPGRPRCAPDPQGQAAPAQRVRLRLPTGRVDRVDPPWVARPDLPASTRIGAAAESDLLPATGAEIGRLGLHPREVALDGGFFPSGVAEHLPSARRAFVAGRQGAGSRRTNRRLARYRVGCEGRISHLKRRYGLRRSRLRGQPGARTWVAWAVLAYNLDTLAIRGA